MFHFLVQRTLLLALFSSSTSKLQSLYTLATMKEHHSTANLLQMKQQTRKCIVSIGDWSKIEHNVAQLLKHWLHSSESALTTETCVELKLNIRGVHRTGNHLSGDYLKFKDCGLFKNQVCTLFLQLEPRSNSHINVLIAAPLFSSQQMLFGIQHENDTHLNQVFTWLCSTNVSVFTINTLYTLYVTVFSCISYMLLMEW